MRGALAAIALLVPAIAAAQPAPAPQPVPQPNPYPYYYPPPPPPKKEPSIPPAMVFFHGVCPPNKQPMCTVGLWMGFHGSKILGAADESFGLATDFETGFGGGFGIEMSTPSDDPMDTDEGGHFLANAEAGVGAGIRSGRLELITTVGIGGEVVAWGSTHADDDPWNEAYWYGRIGVGIDLDGYTLQLAGAHKLKNLNIVDTYVDRVEVGASFKTPKEPIALSIWYSTYDDGTLITGLAMGVGR